MAIAMIFTEGDRHQLHARGVTLDEATRHLDLLRRPASYATLVRACTLGDGIEAVPDDALPALHARHDGAAAAGRFIKFVPASGVASRMFKELLYFQRGPGRQLSWPAIEASAASGEPEARALVDFLAHVRRFAFSADLERQLETRGESLIALAAAGGFRPVLDALLDAEGLALASRPKALIPFHAYEGEARTPFTEHLVESAALHADERGTCQLHFTISPEHRSGFRAFERSAAAEHGRRLGVRFEIELSEQDPATDTLASDGRGRPLRDAAGRLAFRPGGHGALIGNLDDLHGDLVFVRNIDNVQLDRNRAECVRWKKALGGHLLALQERVFDYMRRLGEPDPPPELLDEALRFVRDGLHVDADSHLGPQTYQTKRAFLINRLNRPLRVCGVVRNSGEPGGGPFWVRRDGATTLQIVEAAQVDPGDPAQQAILRSSTHFNPVDMVCAVRDAVGKSFDLASFVDSEAVIVTRKSADGQDITVLERPGLWNGAMAEWNTVFVEVPLATFTPVKSVLDLLRPEHQGSGRSG